MAPSDEAIIELYMQRDASAIRATAERYEHYLMKISYNILGDMEDCKENVNDTYFRTWNLIPPQRPAVLSAFLGKINREGAIDIYRRKKSKKRSNSEYDLCLHELDEELASGASVEDVVEAGMMGRLVNHFLESLPKDKRILFVGRYYYMDSVQEIAGYTGLSCSNVKVTLHRLRKELKHYLQKEGFAV